MTAEWRSDGDIATFTYDLAGNRTVLQERLAGGTNQLTTAVYDIANQLVTETTVGPGTRATGSRRSTSRAASTRSIPTATTTCERA